MAEYSFPNTYIVFWVTTQNNPFMLGVVPAPLKNRLTLIEVKFDLESTMNYFRLKGVQPEILGFMKLNPDLIGTDTSELPIGENFVTPRTLLRMSYFLTLAKGNHRLLESLAKGTLGTDSGEKFIAYLTSVHGTLEVEDVLNSQTNSKRTLPRFGIGTPFGEGKLLFPVRRKNSKRPLGLAWRRKAWRKAQFPKFNKGT